MFFIFFFDSFKLNKKENFFVCILSWFMYLHFTRLHCVTYGGSVCRIYLYINCYNKSCISTYLYYIVHRTSQFLIKHSDYEWARHLMVSFTSLIIPLIYRDMAKYKKMIKRAIYTKRKKNSLLSAVR